MGWTGKYTALRKMVRGGASSLGPDLAFFRPTVWRSRVGKGLVMEVNC